MNNINSEINPFKGIGNVFKVNKKKKRIINKKIFLKHQLLFTIASEEYNLTSLSKLLKKSPQNVSYHLRKLQKEGLIRQIYYGKSVFWKITDLGLLTKNRLSNSILSYSHRKVIPNKLIGKYRLHNFTAIAKLKEKQSNKFHKVSDHVQFSNDFAFIHYSTSIVVGDMKDIDYIFKSKVKSIIQKDMSDLPLIDFCSYYVDVAELLSLKKIEYDFLNHNEFQSDEYWHDCSEGYPEREKRVFVTGEFYN
jgi:DNA-binding transcriptional ArsR family regulator